MGRPAELRHGAGGGTAGRRAVRGRRNRLAEILDSRPRRAVAATRTGRSPTVPGVLPGRLDNSRAPAPCPQPASVEGRDSVRRAGRAARDASPCSTIRPCSNTRMRSAPRMVDRRWAMTMVVRPTISSSIAAWTSRSVSTSSDEVASSRTRIGAVGQEGAGDRHPLPLAARQLDAALADQGRRSPCGSRAMKSWARRPLGGAARPRPWRRVRAARRRCSRASERWNSAGSCGTTAIGAAQAALGDRGDVLAVHQDLAALHVVEPLDQLDEGRLARARGPDQRHPLARRDAQGEVGRRAARSADL